LGLRDSILPEFRRTTSEDIEN